MGSKKGETSQRVDVWLNVICRMVERFSSGSRAQPHWRSWCMHTVTASLWTLSPLPSFLMADVSEPNRLLQRFSFLPLKFGDVSPHFDAFQWIEEEFDNFFVYFINYLSVWKKHYYHLWNKWLTDGFVCTAGNGGWGWDWCNASSDWWWDDSLMSSLIWQTPW